MSVHRLTGSCVVLAAMNGDLTVDFPSPLVRGARGWSDDSEHAQPADHELDGNRGQ